MSTLEGIEDQGLSLFYHYLVPFSPSHVWHRSLAEQPCCFRLSFMRPPTIRQQSLESSSTKQQKKSKLLINDSEEGEELSNLVKKESDKKANPIIKKPRDPSKSSPTMIQSGVKRRRSDDADSSLHDEVNGVVKGKGRRTQRKSEERQAEQEE